MQQLSRNTFFCVVEITTSGTACDAPKSKITFDATAVSGPACDAATGSDFAVWVLLFSGTD